MVAPLLVPTLCVGTHAPDAPRPRRTAFPGRRFRWGGPRCCRPQPGPQEPHVGRGLCGGRGGHEGPPLGLGLPQGRPAPADAAWPPSSGGVAWDVEAPPTTRGLPRRVPRRCPDRSTAAARAGGKPRYSRGRDAGFRAFSSAATTLPCPASKRPRRPATLAITRSICAAARSLTDRGLFYHSAPEWGEGRIETRRGLRLER